MQENKDIRNWVIYRITSPSGRVYIGRTSNFKQRVRQYRYAAKKNLNCIINKSLCKYGFGNHTIEIIDSFCGDLPFCQGKEMFWIRSYMSNVNRWTEMNGLNLNDGGDGNIGHKLSDETKKKLSDWNKANPSLGGLGKSPSKETRLKMSAAKIGKSPWNKGKKGSQVAWNKGLKAGNPWNKGSKFDYLTNGERKERFGKHNIGNTYNRGRKFSDDIVEQMRQRSKRPVVAFLINGEKVGEFDSCASASKALMIGKRSITNLLKDRVRTPTKYIFKYAK